MKLHFAGKGVWPKNRNDFRTGLIQKSFGFDYLSLNIRNNTMEYATAWYVSEPYAEIYVFVDEAPSDLPESAVKIVDEKDPEAFLAALQPYFVMAADS